jgi:hypothetical protein
MTWVAAFVPAPCLAWGPLGHRTVAETASLLVQDDLPATWGPLLARHRFELGVYSFVPDARFRHIDGHGGSVEAPTHYLNLDAREGERTGAVDRRVAQFLELAGAELKEVHAPTGGYVRGATAKGDAGRIYLALFDLGVMAHYSGDASMPYHATADSNGFSQGEGGIHFYFESACVDAFEPALAVEVLAQARRYRARWLADWGAAKVSPSQLVVAVLEDSLAAVAAVADLDKRHAVVRLAKAGSKDNARRKPAAEGCKAMRPLLVERLAKGAVLTAFLWESVLPEGVDFSGATELQFSDMELEPAYLPPR